ncbi:hypothetical protein J2T09_000699 [Neorhizobium huautlense]|uniref:Anti-sigma factor NepR domain-containing protein n=1 Tax=Neorhizobium huautlense TaxID=67774 RepID=A0ABT9PNE6_9HYPH|nr:hypothetical protein [Neorhizobium huautlense]MDP9835957.1 hypothetical protein [Neorhizobium huautlense]
MTKDSTLVPEEPATLGSRVTQEVAVLLTEIEKEDVPDRLLKLAQDLQKALHDKLADKA